MPGLELLVFMGTLGHQAPKAPVKQSPVDVAAANYQSLGWFKGHVTGNPDISGVKPWFPVKSFPSIQ